VSETPGRHATSDYDYRLPPERIARYPAVHREESRLLVLRRATGAHEHRTFRDLPEYLSAGDVLVLNETRVIPARLAGRRAGGGAAEVLLVRPAGPAAGPDAPGDGLAWEALVRPGAKLRPGRRVEIGPELEVEVEAALPGGTRLVRLHTSLSLEEALARYGEVPLPPYLGRAPEPADAERYQTVYATAAGSVAAPTAGLHFTPALLDRIQAAGVDIARIVLHVGVGTFRPVEAEDPAEHRMHAEWYDVPRSAADAIAGGRERGGSVWAVGTTVARTLESAADDAGRPQAGSGWTELFIRPPYRFRAVDRLITNFHLPRSTLLMLVAAFGGYAPVMRAYREAVAREYRFFSYGDAMAIV
jgi:S-adenosylmethionine:tRNA ribosyltransferase-isomerase